MDDDTATGRLVWHLASRWRAQVDRAVSHLGLTHAQYSLLGALYQLTRQGDRPSQRALADYAELDPIYVSKIVRSLETAGLLTRSGHPTDSRAYLLSVTDRGEQVITTAVTVVHRLLHQLTAPIGGPAGPRNRALIATLRSLLGTEPGTTEGSQPMTAPTLTGQDISEAQGALSVLLDGAIAGSGISSEEYITFKVVTSRGPFGTLDALRDHLAIQPQLRLDTPAAGRLVDGLAGRDLITSGDPVALTDAGAGLFATLNDRIAKVAGPVYGSVDPDDLATARRVLNQLAERARAVSGA